MLAILASLFVGNPQRIGDVIPTPGSYVLFVHLFGDGTMSTALS